jgi:hypothetical protein
MTDSETVEFLSATTAEAYAPRLPDEREVIADETVCESTFCRVSPRIDEMILDVRSLS